MQLFYASEISGNMAFMDESESVHCLRVLRKKKGDSIEITDGKGKIYQAVIIQDNPRRCGSGITGEIEAPAGHSYYLHIGIAPTKNTDRLEWFVEKAVEIGIDRISLLICKHSERKKIRADRLEKIAVSAMKQSLKAKLPVIDEAQPFESFLDAEYPGFQKYIAHLEESGRRELLKMDGNSDKYIILIGPEGDFHPDEIKKSISMGFTPVSLGNSRLRTETAGIVACQVISDRESLKFQ